MPSRNFRSSSAQQPRLSLSSRKKHDTLVAANLRCVICMSSSSSNHNVLDQTGFPVLYLTKVTPQIMELRSHHDNEDTTPNPAFPDPAMSPVIQRVGSLQIASVGI